MIDIELQRARSAMAESVTLPIATWLEALDELETLRMKAGQQEPVTYRVWDRMGGISYRRTKPSATEYVEWDALYAAPVRTKDLTEPMIDELRECRDLLMCVESCSRNNFENLAYERVQAIDAVIAADREKNK